MSAAHSSWTTRRVAPAPPCVERSGLTQGGLQQLVVPDQAYSERLLALASGRRAVRRGDSDRP